MQIFQNRPLALAMCLFALTALVAYSLSGTLKVALLLLAFASLTVVVCRLLFKKKRSTRGILAALCLFAVLGALLSSFLCFNVRFASHREKEGTPREVEGYVLERLSYGAFYSSFRVRLTSIDGKALLEDAVLECEFTSSLQVGDRFVANGTQRAFVQEESFDEKLYRLASGCFLILSCADSDSYTILQEPSRAPTVLLLQWNQRLSYQLESIKEEGSGLSAALLLGNRRWLSADTELSFRRAGVSHLLALSGLHVSILIGFFGLLFRLLRLGHLTKLILMPCFSIFYLALTGFAASTFRAVLMLCVLYCGFLLRRSYDSFTSLCTALTVILLLTPHAVLDASMWLSFVAAGSIIIFYPAVFSRLENWRKNSKLPDWVAKQLCKLAAAISIGIITNLSLLLISALLFGEVSMASVPATLLLSLPVTLLIILSLVLLCAPFLPLLPLACVVLERICVTVVTWFSSLDRVLLPMSSPLVYGLLIALAASLVLLAVGNFEGRRRAGLWPLGIAFLAILCAYGVAYLPLQERPTVRTVSVPSGEARLYAQNGSVILVREKGMLSGSYDIKRTALEENGTEIEKLILYNVDNQATYFIASLSSRICIRELHLPIPTTEKEAAIFARVEQEARLHGMDVIYDADRLRYEYP